MAGILQGSMVWRGYNIPDPNNSFFTTTAGRATTIKFTLPSNRVLVYNLGQDFMYVKFNGDTASTTSYDVVLPPYTGLAIPYNGAYVSVYTNTYADTCYIGGLREDNTAL